MTKINKQNNQSSIHVYFQHPFVFFLIVLIIVFISFSVLSTTHVPQEKQIIPFKKLNISFRKILPDIQLTNYTYFIFLLISIIGFYLIPTKIRWIWLLICNTYFIAGQGFFYIVPLAFIGLLSFFVAYLINKQESNTKKRRILYIGIILCVSLLASFKFISPFTWSLNNISHHFKVLYIILPLGISFYTFQAIAYMMNVYIGKIKPEPHLGWYLVSLSFFPKFFSGPIERKKNFIQQFYKNNTFKLINFNKGSTRILWGVFKKIIFVNRMNNIIDVLFTCPETLSSLEIWFSVILYSLYIYIDFSAYCDIAIGSANLFSISLTENFNRPYFSKSIQEFWQRWHISFSTWLQDYIFLPLNFATRRIRSKFVKYSNIIIVFLISGLWHGSTLYFIIWGALHGIAQVCQIQTKTIINSIERELSIKKGSSLWKFFHVGFTFSLITIFWVFFGAPTITIIKEIFKGLIFNNAPLLTFSPIHFSLQQPDIIIIFCGLALMILMEFLSRKSDLLTEFLNLYTPIRVSITVLAVLLIIIFGDYQIGISNSFIYDQF